jgi:hypothetical protein
MKKSVKLYYAREGLRLIRREIKKIEKRELYRIGKAQEKIYVYQTQNYIAAIKHYIRLIDDNVKAIEQRERDLQEKERIEKKKIRTQNSNQTGTYGRQS